MFPMTPPCQSFCFNNFFFFDDSVNFLSSETKNVHMNQHPFHYLFDLLENLTNALLPNCACKETRAHSAVSRFTVLESSIAPVLIIERDGHFLITILTWFFSSYISLKRKKTMFCCCCVNACIVCRLTLWVPRCLLKRKKNLIPFYMISHSQKKKSFFFYFQFVQCFLLYIPPFIWL